MKLARVSAILLILAVGLSLTGCNAGEDWTGDEYAEESHTDEDYGEAEDEDESGEADGTTDVSIVGGNGDLARQHLEALTEIGPRWSGSEEEMEAGQYILEALDEMGYGVERQPFTATSDDGDTITSANIIAVKDGLLPEVIVVGAHYDSSDEGLGSDDNGSGVAVLLEVAELVAGETTPYTIYFIAFGAEEAGLLGSNAFVDALGDSELSGIILYVNLDSICAGDVTYIYSGSDTGALDWEVDWAVSNGYDLEPIPNADLTTDGEDTADYAAFEDAGIPWVYFEATNWDLGDQDGYTQVDPQYGDNGAIIHTKFDDLYYFDEVFPGRVEHRLDLYVSVLYALLTEYE
ncbi:MAG: M20/M25/M40 family metallo-hydrolase [Chloroflexi bacterium]|nr:M20/M25/M40 family metallo-hydrolase [Chloroflexota bacterium]